MNNGSGYTVGSAGSHSVTVNDNDATTVRLAGAAGNVTEGSTKAITITLGRGLERGETLTVPLTFAGTATQKTDYTLAGTYATGITYANLNSSSARVVFTGPNSGTTATVAAMTLTASTDSIAESTPETVNIGLGTLVYSGLGGGAGKTDSLAEFSIEDPLPKPDPCATIDAPWKEDFSAPVRIFVTPAPIPPGPTTRVRLFRAHARTRITGFAPGATKSISGMMRLRTGIRHAALRPHTLS